MWVGMLAENHTQVRAPRDQAGGGAAGGGRALGQAACASLFRTSRSSRAPARNADLLVPAWPASRRARCWPPRSSARRCRWAGPDLAAARRADGLVLLNRGCARRAGAGFPLLAGVAVAAAVTS